MTLIQDIFILQISDTIKYKTDICNCDWDTKVCFADRHSQKRKDWLYTVLPTSGFVKPEPILFPCPNFNLGFTRGYTV